jgi:SAM-dependent methyltransferase
MEKTPIRVWKSADDRDDRAPLSFAARASLAVGWRLKALGFGQPVREELSEERFSNFLRLSPHIQRCQGMTIVDIGGGTGELSAHLAGRGARYVWCVEPNPDLAAVAKQTVANCNNAQVVQAVGQEAGEIIGQADRIILHEVMQHADQPLDLLVAVRDMLSPSGLAFVMFVPWSSPYGAHTRDLLPVPWVHLLYPRSVLAEMRSSASGWHTKDLGDTGLYKMGVGPFLTLVEQAGLEVVTLQLLPVWRQNWMTRWPVLRELGTVSVGAVFKNSV